MGLCNIPLNEEHDGTPDGPKVHSSHGGNMDTSSIAWMESVDLWTPLREMRKRYKRDGYVWIKNLIPREDVLKMREQYFQHLSPTGLLKPSTNPIDGIFNPSNDPLSYQGVGGHPQAQCTALLESAHTTPAFDAFCAHPALRTFVRNFTGWEQEVMLKRAMMRHNCPGSLATGVHYDKLFLRGSDADFLTAWVPIGDCTARGGGLMYLEHSDQLGRELEQDFKHKNAGLSQEERVSAFNKHMAADGYLSHDAEGFRKTEAQGSLKWLVGDFEAGDVVFHTPHMIHSSTANEDEKGRIRLGSDLRFYEAGAPIDERWSKPWTNDDKL
ncbi:MAG: hypothetical protein Q9220_005492 [cf. Caloplaca sp. 1 TL-2023]